MTNEEAKQEAIKAAWGETVGSLNLSKLRLDEDGYSDFQCKKYIPEHSTDRLLYSKVRYAKSKLHSDKIVYRPKSLNGIELNNGWTRIEPDGGNLPALKGKYDFCINGEPCFDSPEYKPMSCQTLINTFYELQGDNEITHYKPIKEEPKPLY